MMNIMSRSAMVPAVFLCLGLATPAMAGMIVNTEASADVAGDGDAAYGAGAPSSVSVSTAGGSASAYAGTDGVMLFDARPNAEPGNGASASTGVYGQYVFENDQPQHLGFAYNIAGLEFRMPVNLGGGGGLGVSLSYGIDGPTEWLIYISYADGELYVDVHDSVQGFSAASCTTSATEVVCQSDGISGMIDIGMIDPFNDNFLPFNYSAYSYIAFDNEVLPSVAPADVSMLAAMVADTSGPVARLGDPACLTANGRCTAGIVLLGDTPTDVPEPASAALLGAGLLGLGLARRRNRRG